MEIRRPAFNGGSVSYIYCNIFGTSYSLYNKFGGKLIGDRCAVWGSVGDINWFEGIKRR